MPGAGLSCRPLWAPLLHPFPQADFRWLFPKAKATRDGGQSQSRTARRGNVHLMYYACGHGLIELSQMILAWSEDTEFARLQHGVMARSLIIAHAHRQRQWQRQAGAPLILIEIDSFSGLPGERNRGKGEGNVKVACHTQLKVKNSEPTWSYLWYLPSLLLPCIDSSCDTVPNILCSYRQSGEQVGGRLGAGRC